MDTDIKLAICFCIGGFILLVGGMAHSDYRKESFMTKCVKKHLPAECATAWK